MRLCAVCLSKHAELETRAGHPYDIGMCEECLQVCLVSSVFERPLEQGQTQFVDVESIHGVEMVSENEDWLKEAVLSQYVGQKCVYCQQMFVTVESLQEAVWAIGGIAHNMCWRQFCEL